MRIAGRNINLIFWVKTSLKTLLVLLAPVYALVEVDARLPGLEGYGGNYNCILFTVWALHYSRDVFITIQTPATILAAVGICVPGIYFTRQLSHKPRTAPFTDMALASGFATVFGALYCAYWISLDYTLLTVGSFAMVVFVVLPIFLREAELVGLARVLTDPDGSGVAEDTQDRAMRIPRKYTVVGAALAVAALLTPDFLMVHTWSFGGTIRLQLFSLFSNILYDVSILVPYWSASSSIVSFDALFMMFFVHGARILFALGILRYWRGLTSRTRVVLVGATGSIVPAIVYELVQDIFVLETLVFSAPLPLLFVTGVLATTRIHPVQVENLQILERDSEAALQKKESEELTLKVDVPFLYALKSRVVLALSKLRREKTDTESESEMQAS